MSLSFYNVWRGSRSHFECLVACKQIATKIPRNKTDPVPIIAFYFAWFYDFTAPLISILIGLN